MTEDDATPADQVIEALTDVHRRLVDLVGRLDDDRVTSASACADWDVSQVLGHLGSGAVLALDTLDAAIAGADGPALDNQAVWDRWDGMSPIRRAEESVEANTALVERLTSLDAVARQELRVPLPFLPAPADLATFAALRLNETTLHLWDLEVVSDHTATLVPSAVVVLIDRSGPLIGFLGRGVTPGDATLVEVATTDPERSFGLRLGDSVSVEATPSATDSHLTAPAEAYLRLLAGRLAAQWTPPEVRVDSPTLTLDELRRIFPGF